MNRSNQYLILHSPVSLAPFPLHRIVPRRRPAGPRRRKQASSDVASPHWYSVRRPDSYGPLGVILRRGTPESTGGRGRVSGEV